MNDDRQPRPPSGTLLHFDGIEAVALLRLEEPNGDAVTVARELATGALLILITYDNGTGLRTWARISDEQAAQLVETTRAALTSVGPQMSAARRAQVEITATGEGFRAAVVADLGLFSRAVRDGLTAESPAASVHTVRSYLGLRCDAVESVRILPPQASTAHPARSE
ncbi:hypothetical protein [Nocardia heshunensis]